MAAGLGRERLKSSRLTAHMGRNEPFNAMWSLVCFLRSVVVVHWQRQSTPRHPPRGCFRYGYERLDSLVPPYPRTPSPLVGSSGRLLFGGRKESFPQLLLILVPSDSVVAQPPSSFSLVYVVVSLPLRTRPTSMRVGARP